MLCEPMAWSAPLQAVAPQTLTFANITDLEIPKELGTIRDRYQGSDERTIFLIQDAHCVFQAQTSIQALIAYFQEKQSVSLITFEGGSGELDLMALRAFPDQTIKQAVLLDYTRRGEVSGVELAAALNTREGNYYAIEDMPLYRENRKAFLEAQANQALVLQRIEAWQTALRRVKETLYSEPLLELDQWEQKVERKASEIPAYIRRLEDLAAKSQIQLERYPQVKAMMQALAMQDGENSEWLAHLDKADQLIREATAQLPAVLNGKALQEFGRRVQTFQTGRAPKHEQVRFLIELAEEAELELPHQALLKALLTRVGSVEDMRGTHFFQELRALADAVRETLYTKPDQAEAHHGGRYLKLLSDMSRLHLSRDAYREWLLTDGTERLEEIETFLKRHGQPFELSLEMRGPEDFYKAAMNRDQALFQNLLATLRREKQQSAIMVTGGFHTQGFTDYLREQGLSFAVIAPAFTELGDESLYPKVMRGEVSYRETTEVHERLQREIYQSDLSAVISRLREWRGRIVNRAFEKGMIKDAAEYTHYVDSLFQVISRETGRQALAPEIAALGSLRENFLDAVSTELTLRLAQSLQSEASVANLADQLEQRFLDLVGDDVMTAIADNKRQFAAERGRIAAIRLEIRRDLAFLKQAMTELETLSATGELTVEAFERVFKERSLGGRLLGLSVPKTATVPVDLVEALSQKSLEQLVPVAVDYAEEVLGIKDPQVRAEIDALFERAEPPLSPAQRLAALQQAIAAIRTQQVLPTGLEAASLGEDEAFTPFSGAASRRDFMKLSALLGGAVAAAPLIQAASVFGDDTPRPALSRAERAVAEKMEEEYLNGVFNLVHDNQFSTRPTRLPLDVAALRDARTGTLQPAVSQDETRAADLKVSPSNIGFRLLTIMAQLEKLKGNRSRSARMKRLQLADDVSKYLTFLEGAQTKQGFYYRYYWMHTSRFDSNGLPSPAKEMHEGKEREVEISSVDNANLTAALIAAAAYFKTDYAAYSARMLALLDKQDYLEFYDPAHSKMNHGFHMSGETKVFMPYHYDLYFTEARLLAFVALALNKNAEKQADLEKVWRELKRETSEVKVGEETLTITHNFGGSLFEYLHGSLLLDEQQYGSDKVKEALANAIKVQQSEATNGFWGRAPAFGEDGKYHDSGSKILGKPGYPKTHIAPYTWGLAAPFDPQAAVAQFQRLMRMKREMFNPRVGTYDAFNPETMRFSTLALSWDTDLTALGLNHLMQRVRGEKTISDWFWEGLGVLKDIERADRDTKGKELLGAASLGADGSAIPGEADEALKHYDIGEVENIGYASKRLDRVFVVTTGQGKFILKRPVFRRDPQRIEWEAKVLEGLSARGVKVANIIKTRLGENYVLGADEEPYVLYEYLESERSYRDEWVKAQDLAAPAEYLARLHDAARELNIELPAPLNKEMPQGEGKALALQGMNYEPVTVNGRLSVLRAQLQSRREVRGELLNEIENLFLDHYEELTPHMTAIEQNLDEDTLAALVQTIIRGDYHQFNASYANGEVGSFDFEFARPHARVFDLINGFEHYPTQDNERALNLDHLSLFLEAYQKKTKVPLSERELDLFVDVVRLFYLQTIGYIAILETNNKDAREPFESALLNLSNLKELEDRWPQIKNSVLAAAFTQERIDNAYYGISSKQEALPTIAQITARLNSSFNLQVDNAAVEAYVSRIPGYPTMEYPHMSAPQMLIMTGSPSSAGIVFAETFTWHGPESDVTDLPLAHPEDPSEEAAEKLDREITRFQQSFTLAAMTAAVTETETGETVPLMPNGEKIYARYRKYVINQLRRNEIGYDAKDELTHEEWIHLVDEILPLTDDALEKAMKFNEARRDNKAEIIEETRVALQSRRAVLFLAATDDAGRAEVQSIITNSKEEFDPNNELTFTEWNTLLKATFEGAEGESAALSFFADREVSKKALRDEIGLSVQLRFEELMAKAYGDATRQEIFDRLIDAKQTLDANATWSDAEWTWLVTESVLAGTPSAKEARENLEKTAKDRYSERREAWEAIEQENMRLVKAEAEAVALEELTAEMEKISQEVRSEISQQNQSAAFVLDKILLKQRREVDSLITDSGRSVTDAVGLGDYAAIVIRGALMRFIDEHAIEVLRHPYVDDATADAQEIATAEQLKMITAVYAMLLDSPYGMNVPNESASEINQERDLAYLNMQVALGIGSPVLGAVGDVGNPEKKLSAFKAVRDGVKQVREIAKGFRAREKLDDKEQLYNHTLEIYRNAIPPELRDTSEEERKKALIGYSEATRVKVENARAAHELAKKSYDLTRGIVEKIEEQAGYLSIALKRLSNGYYVIQSSDSVAKKTQKKDREYNKFLEFFNKAKSLYVREWVKEKDYKDKFSKQEWRYAVQEVLGESDQDREAARTFFAGRTDAKEKLRADSREFIEARASEITDAVNRGDVGDLFENLRAYVETEVKENGRNSERVLAEYMAKTFLETGNENNDKLFKLSMMLYYLLRYREGRQRNTRPTVIFFPPGLYDDPDFDLVSFTDWGILKADHRDIRGTVDFKGGKSSHYVEDLTHRGGISIVGAKNVPRDGPPSGIPVIIDGSDGTVFVQPSLEARIKMRAKRNRVAMQSSFYRSRAPLEVKIEGKIIHSLADIAEIEELTEDGPRAATSAGVAGVGLYRIENILMDKSREGIQRDPERMSLENSMRKVLRPRMSIAPEASESTTSPASRLR